MAIRLVTDSASDFTKEEAKALGITIVPLTVTFGDTSYQDCFELNHEQFFEKLIETDDLPTTSQIPPYEYGKVFEEISDNGDDILCITLSSKLSGCFQSANIAADDCETPIKIVDSLNAAVGQRLLVEYALRLIKSGMSLDDIYTDLEEQKKHIRLIALLDTLEYLKKGGRISSTVALAGTLLNIKPVIAVIDGAVELLGKARGSKNGNNMLKELINKEGPIDFSKPCSVVYSGLSTTVLDKYMADSIDLYKGHEDELGKCSIGCAIGTHIGPGAIGVAFFV